MAFKTKPLYLDYAAATPVDKQVVAVMQTFWSEVFYNPSGLTQRSLQAKQAIEAARAQIASQIGAKPHQIIFTSGATEANNLALKGVGQRFPAGKLLVSAVEHESVLGPAKEVDAGLVPVNSNGEIVLVELEAMITDDTVLISVIHTNNEIGTIQPLKKVAKLIEAIRASRQQRGIELPLLLHSDAVQSPLTLDVHVSRLGVDLMTLSAGKIYGPKGIGCLYVRDRSQLKPLISGGRQEIGLRSGTENVPLIVGFAESLRLSAVNRQSCSVHFRQLKQLLLSELAAKLPDVEVNVKSRQAVDNIISLHIPAVDGEALVMALDYYGIQAATGSACTTSDDQPSHVIRALGKNETEAGQSLRISLGISTTKSDIRRFVKVLLQARSNLK